MVDTLVPLIDFGKQFDQTHEVVEAAIARVVAAHRFIGGPECPAFEAAFSEAALALSADHVVVCDSGTAALTLALTAAGIGTGDEVLVPANSFIASAEAVCHVGGTPVFVDVDPVTAGVTVDTLAGGLTERTRAAMPVHLYGHPAPMPSIMEWARENHLLVVEDCAQAHMASIDGKWTGTFGHFAAFSFFPGKNLGAYGDGGLAVAANPVDASTIRALANHGRSKKYSHDRVGYNLRMDEIQGAILSAKLPYLPAWTECRCVRADQYSERLAGLPIEIIRPAPGTRSAWHLFVIKSDKRDALREHLSEAGIETGIHYPISLHLQPAFRDLGYGRSDLPIAEALTQKILSLPICGNITEVSVAYVCDAVSSFFDL